MFHQQQSTPAASEVSAAHDELRRACVENIRQACNRLERSDISLCAANTTAFHAIHRTAFGGGAGTGSSAAVMGNFRTFVDDYGAANCCPPAFVPGRSKPWPRPIAERMQRAAVTVRCGVFPAISRVWVVIDNQVLLWNYVTDDVTTTIPAFPECVTALHLAEPRRGVFLPTVQFVLVVATARSLHFVGITAADSGDLSSSNNSGASSGSDVAVLELAEYTVQTPAAVTCLTSHRRSGRIFAGATDGFIYELVYSNAEGMLMGRKLTLKNRSIYFGGTAIVSTLSRAAYTLRQTWSKTPNTPLVDIVCSDDRSGTLFALSQAGRIEAWTVEEEDVYGATFGGAASGGGAGALDAAVAPADAGAITFQCAIDHKEATTAYLQEPARRVAGQQQQAQAQQGAGADGAAPQQQQQQQQQRPVVQTLVSLQLPAPGRGGNTSSSSSSSASVIAIDACGARYYYHASSTVSFYSSSSSLELKLSRREAPLRFADGTDTGSRRMRCCALGGDAGTAFCAVYENVNAATGEHEDDVVVLAGPNLLPFAPGAPAPAPAAGAGNAQPAAAAPNAAPTTAASPTEVVSMFSTAASASPGGRGRRGPQSAGALRVHAVADCPHAQLSATGRCSRQFLLVHTAGVTVITALRPVDVLHATLLAPPPLRTALMARVGAVASPADIAYLLLQIVSSTGATATGAATAPTQQQQQSSSPSLFRTVVFAGTNVSASAAPSPATGAAAAAAAAARGAGGGSRAVDVGKCALFEEALLQHLAGGGAPDASVTQAAFDQLKAGPMSNPASMQLARTSSESTLTVIFPPLSGGFISAVAQAVMHVFRLAPLAVAQGATSEKRRAIAQLQTAERLLQGLLDVAARLSRDAVWNSIETATPFLRAGVQVQYDDSAVNIAHSRSCGSAVMRSSLASSGSGNNNANAGGRGGLAAPAPTVLNPQDAHWLLAARMTSAVRIADMARQIAHFWRRACESVAPSIIHAVVQRVGSTASVVDMLLRKDDAAQPARALVRALLAEERTAAVPNFAVWSDLLADLERSCPALYGASDAMESRATLDIQRLARAGTDGFADRSAAERTLLELAQQAHTLWTGEALEPLVWQLHRNGASSIDAVVLLLRAAARLDASTSDASAAVAMRAVVEGPFAAGDGQEQELRDKLRCLECLHSLLEELRRADDATFDLLFSSTRTGAMVPPGWTIWQVEPQDRVTHLSVLAWLAAPRDDPEVSRRLRAHVTGTAATASKKALIGALVGANAPTQRPSALAVLQMDAAPRISQNQQQQGGGGSSITSPFVHDFFELQGTFGGGHNAVVPTATNVFGSVSLEAARYQWHTQRRHDLAVQTYATFAQGPLEAVSLDVRLQTRIDALREAVQCARQGRLDAAHLAKTLQQLDNQRRLLADIRLLPQSVFSAATGAAAPNPLIRMRPQQPQQGDAAGAASGATQTGATINAIVARLSSSVLESEDLFLIGNQLPCGAGFEVQLAMLCAHSIDDEHYFASAVDRAFAPDSLFRPDEAARICLQYHRGSMMFPLDSVVMYLEAANAQAVLQNNNSNNAQQQGSRYHPQQSTVDLLLDAGISAERAWRTLCEVAKMAVAVRTGGAAVIDKARAYAHARALRTYAAHVPPAFAVVSAADALGRYLADANPRPDAAAIREHAEALLRVLQSSPPAAPAQQQHQQLRIDYFVKQSRKMVDDLLRAC